MAVKKQAWRGADFGGVPNEPNEIMELSKLWTINSGIDEIMEISSMDATGGG